MAAQSCAVSGPAARAIGRLAIGRFATVAMVVQQACL
jgi:hypothetical protein